MLDATRAQDMRIPELTREFPAATEFPAAQAVTAMEHLLESGTQRSLLERLARTGTHNQSAWSEFVARYGRTIHVWCLRWGLQPADAQDVTQIVLWKLVRRMKEFTYDPKHRFRSWLKTVTYRAWRDFVASRQSAPLAAGLDSSIAQLDCLAAGDDLARGLEETFDLELLEIAMQRVRLRAATHTWQAFSMTAVQGIPAPEAARRLGMKIARVYAARSAIQERLREECRRLESAAACR
jgi:RNA polymerase sigma-70 factor (ECF subfamily)